MNTVRPTESIEVVMTDQRRRQNLCVDSVPTACGTMLHDHYICVSLGQKNLETSQNWRKSLSRIINFPSTDSA